MPGQNSVLHTWDWMYCLPRCEAFFSCTVMKTARSEASLPSLPQACTICHLVLARPIGSKMQSVQIKDMAELGLADKWIASKVSSWHLWFMSVEIKMHCSPKGPYFRDRVLIGTFLTFWVPIGSLFIFQGPYFQYFGYIHAKNVNSVCMYATMSELDLCSLKP